MFCRLKDFDHVTSQFQQFKTNKNKEFHHSSKTDNPVYTIY